MKRPVSSARSQEKKGGFTLPELLVILATVSLLALMLLPALASTKSDGRIARCMNNQKQLTQAMLLYTTDYNDSFPSNARWINVNGLSLDWLTSPNNTNTAALEDPTQCVMAMYVKAAGLFKCPSDNYQSPGNIVPRVRSISINGALGGLPTVRGVQGIYPNEGSYYGSGGAGAATKITHLIKPGPAQVFAILDEHPDSINDGVFFFDPGAPPGAQYWRDLPASFHDRSGSFSFMDGHWELHKWTGNSFRNPAYYPVIYANYSGGSGPWRSLFFSGPDYVWMNSKMPYR